jgi:pilus assembly protein Flp/PilA
MLNSLMRTYVWAQIWREDNGQDLIEYALIAALIALAATATMGTVASNINNAFLKVNNKLSSAVAAP